MLIERVFGTMIVLRRTLPVRPREAYSRPDSLPPLIVVGGFGEHRRDLVANGTPATIEKRDRTSVVQ